MFADATLAVGLTRRIVRVPSSAVIDDARGTHVATIDGTGAARLIAVQRGIDDGANVDVVEGLAGGERVIANPPADMVDGMRVSQAQY